MKPTRTERSSLLGDIELTATRQDLPETLKVPDAVKTKLENL